MPEPLRLSSDSLLRASERMAGGLRAAGIRAGDVVALRLGPTPHAAALLVALWRMGAVAAPLSTRLPISVLRDALRLVDARALVANEAMEVGVPLLDPAALDAAPAALPAWPDLALDAPATYVFTSGSTGTPKAALHTLGNHVWNARGAAVNMPLSPSDAWLLALPLYHVGGLAILFRVLEAEASVAFGANTSAFAPGISHVSLVATQLARLLREKTPPPASLRAILLGGSAIPASLLDECIARGLPVHTTYGLTEMASQVTTTPPGASRDALRSSGRLLPHRDLRLAGGEIHVRGRTRFVGYQTPGGLVAPFDADGWYATGDLGHLDADGFLHVEGRRDFLFISGGENIQPEEIERALAHAGVTQSIVVPVPDAEFGFRPVAFIAPENLRGVAALRKTLEAVLPRFKIPVAFLPLPESDGLKPDRKVLTERAARHRS